MYKNSNTTQWNAIPTISAKWILKSKAAGDRGSWRVGVGERTNLLILFGALGKT